jgi:hypothetical protein
MNKFLWYFAVAMVFLQLATQTLASQFAGVTQQVWGFTSVLLGLSVQFAFVLAAWGLSNERNVFTISSKFGIELRLSPTRRGIIYGLLISLCSVPAILRVPTLGAIVPAAVFAVAAFGIALFMSLIRESVIKRKMLSDLQFRIVFVLFGLGAVLVAITADSGSDAYSFLPLLAGLYFAGAYFFWVLIGSAGLWFLSLPLNRHHVIRGISFLLLVLAYGALIGMGSNAFLAGGLPGYVASFIAGLLGALLTVYADAKLKTATI